MIELRGEYVYIWDWYPSTISTFILAGTLFKFNFHLVSQYNTENSCVLQSTNPHEPNPCCILSYEMILSENGAYTHGKKMYVCTYILNICVVYSIMYFKHVW